MTGQSKIGREVRVVQRPGRAAGASDFGTSEIESWPVKLVPPMTAVAAGTINATPKVGLETVVVAAGFTVVKLSFAIRGRKNGRLTTLAAFGTISISSRKP